MRSSLKKGTLQRILAIGIVRHLENGILFTQEQIRQGFWSFCQAEVEPGEDWRNVLYFAIKQKTWIEKIAFEKILWAQSFPPKVILPDATFCFFVYVKTQETGHNRGYQWIKKIEDLENLALFHPLVKSLCEDVFHETTSLENK